MCILRFAYAHCIYSLFDYEIVRACNGALHVMVNVDALVRDIGISSLVFSRSLFAMVARRGAGGGAIIFCETSERETARGEKVKGV